MKLQGGVGEAGMVRATNVPMSRMIQSNKHFHKYSQDFVTSLQCCIKDGHPQIHILLTKSVCEVKMTSHHRVHVGKQVQNEHHLYCKTNLISKTSWAFEHSDPLKSSPGIILCQLVTLWAMALV